MDRRLETLTQLDFSLNTPGLSAVGGEAGLIFLIPSAI